MLTEHDLAGEVLARLRSLTANYSTRLMVAPVLSPLYEGLHQLEADTHLHIHKENNVLFPAVVALEQRLTRSVRRRNDRPTRPQPSRLCRMSRRSSNRLGGRAGLLLPTSASRPSASPTVPAVSVST